MGVSLVLTAAYPFTNSQALTMAKMAAIRSQVRPWMVRGPRVRAVTRNARATVARMYFVVMSDQTGDESAVPPQPR